mmetsp:Transcript_13191/g.27910  ORF Transcript_13191/g.27910 Transcript_13191/m.27910 type:complete len:316 (-) Transcript_13191:105-1052(-)
MINGSSSWHQRFDMINNQRSFGVCSKAETKWIQRLHPILPLVTGSTDALNVGNLSSLQRCPLPTLVVANTESHKGQNNHVFAGILFSLFRLGLGGPTQKLGNVSGLLRYGGLCSVLVLDTTVIEWGRHRDSSSGKVGIVMKTRHHFFSGRSIAVSGQKRKNVIRTVVSGFDHQTQIGWVCTAVGSTTGLFVGVGRWNYVVWFTGALEHFSLVVGAIEDVYVLCHFLHFFFRVGHSDEFTESNVMQRMARSTNLTVHLVPTTKGRMVKRGKISLVTPRVVRWVDYVFLVHESDRYGGYSRHGGCSSGQSVSTEQTW